MALGKRYNTLTENVYHHTLPNTPFHMLDWHGGDCHAG
jgi:hypothetical protein